MSDRDTDSGVKINIRCSNNAKFSVKIGLQATVADFKNKIAENCDVAANQQRLIYKGRILKDDQTLDSYGISSLSLYFIFIYYLLGTLYDDVVEF